MADKKITELGQLPTLSADDLFVVVDDPGGTPITKSTTAGNVFSFIKNTLISNAISLTTSGADAGNTAFKVLLSSGGTTNAAITTLTGAEVIVSANAGSTNTATQFGLSVSSKLLGATANVKTTHAVGNFILDVSNAASLIANTYGLRIQVANSDTRVANVQSFLRLEDLAANSTTAQTLYLFDANGVSANLSSGTGNALTLLANSAAGAATHRLRVRINNTDYWILLTDTAS